MDLSDLRVAYTQSRLSFDNLLEDPIQQFELWFKEAQTKGIPEPNAMSLGTISEDNIPNLRTVLLKHFDEKGFVFYTNYSSQKAKEMEYNHNVVLLFPWLTVQRQVKIIGTVKKVSRTESLKYFLSRPFKSQIGAWVSQQSSQISSRKILLDKYWELRDKFKNGEVPLPDFWGGYRVHPTQIEFWQGGEHRLHDRFLYKREGDRWNTSIISP